jgi:hypothetical protein
VRHSWRTASQRFFLAPGNHQNYFGVEGKKTAHNSAAMLPRTVYAQTRKAGLTPPVGGSGYAGSQREDYFEVKAELERIASFQKRQGVPKTAITREQRMIRELQGIFCKGRYRSWRPSSGL